MCEFNELKQIATKKNCVAQQKGGFYILYRRAGKGITFIGQRNNLKDFEKLIKKA